MDQEGDTELQRICSTCVAAEQSSQATTGKGKLGSAASGKGGIYNRQAQTRRVEKNVSDDEQERMKMIRGDARCHRLMRNFRPTSVF